MLSHIFLSPHFDDAIGSCGGTISRLVRLGHSVQIVTAFGGIEREPFSEPAEVLHREWKLPHPVSYRRLEDASACSVIKCESTFFEFPDAVYRQDTKGRHLYPTFEALRGLVADEDRTLACHLALQLSSYLSGNSSVLYCPMGIGGHVDHIIARDCGRHFKERGDSAVVYYREFYYDLSCDPIIEDAALEQIRIDLKRIELEAKIAAFSEYTSQIPALFRDYDGMVCYFSTIGGNELVFVPRASAAARQLMLRELLKPAECGMVDAQLC